MTTVFGVSSTSISIALVIVFGVFMGSAVLTFIRNRVVFRLGVRNLPRRPAQTVLIVIGLMLSTVIFAAALTTGDTLNHSIRSDAIRSLGPTDEVIVPSSGSDDGFAGIKTGAQIPDDVVQQIIAELADVPEIDGILPLLVHQVPVVNLRTGLSEPSITMAGIESVGAASFGGLIDIDGQPVDLASLSGVVLSTTAAERIDAQVGDDLVIYIRNQSHSVTVEAIADDSPLTGSLGGSQSGGFAIPLHVGQTLFEQPSFVSLIAISNTGGTTDGVRHTDAVIAAANEVLTGSPYRTLPIKRNSIEEADAEGSMFIQVFVIFGLFSISVGVLLIFLIFMMLAAERKPEIGMARAVGLKRRQVTQMFLAEGISYALIAASIGVALGVGVAFLMVDLLSGMFGDDLDLEPITTWRSLLISYTLGVVVTFVTIVISSWRVSRVNITSAIRDVTDPTRLGKSRRWVLIGLAGIVFSALMFWNGASTESMFRLSVGISLAPFSLAVLLRGFNVPARPVYSVAAVSVLTYWLLPMAVLDQILPKTNVGIELFFLSGIMMVASATILVIWNSDVMTFIVHSLGRGPRRLMPTLRTAMAYPMANRVRTGMTIAMFSLVVFSLVMMAAINVNMVAIFSGENAGGGWSVQASQPPTNPIGDFRQTLIDNGVDVSPVMNTTRMMSKMTNRTQIREVGNDTWKTHPVHSIDASFIDHSTIVFQVRANGYESDAEVWDALRTNPDLAIVDGFVLPNIGLGGASFRLQGVTQADKTMLPPVVEIADPSTGRSRTVEVIGVMRDDVYAMSGIFVHEQVFADVFEQPDVISYLLQLDPEVDEVVVARSIEAGLIEYGVQAESIRKVVDEMVGLERSLMRLFEGFMGLGLIVGIAAVGVIAFRSVIERRQQIGVLRAIGYRRSMVSTSFMVESMMTTLIGVGTGTILGLLLAWKLLSSDFFFEGSGQGFLVPWVDVVICIVVSLGASLLMSYIPAHRAANVPIATALRYE